MKNSNLKEIAGILCLCACAFYIGNRLGNTGLTPRTMPAFALAYLIGGDHTILNCKIISLKNRKIRCDRLNKGFSIDTMPDSETDQDVAQ